MSEVLATKNAASRRNTVRALRRPRYSDIFLPLLNAPADRPFVVAQLGQSLDGRIATMSGESRWINGWPALDHLHRLRAHVDAVVVGIRTAEADDPALTVRRVEGESPARVVLDPSGRLSAHSKCLIEDGVGRIVIGPQRNDLPSGVQLVDPREVCSATDERQLCPRAIAQALFDLGMKRLLIEGGAWTVSRFIEAHAIDRLHMLVAPVILGSGKPGIDLTPITSLDDALRPPAAAYVLEEGEVVFDCDLKGIDRGRGQTPGI